MSARCEAGGNYGGLGSKCGSAAWRAMAESAWDSVESHPGVAIARAACNDSAARRPTSRRLQLA